MSYLISPEPAVAIQSLFKAFHGETLISTRELTPDLYDEAKEKNAALVTSTSGSTGTPKLVPLTAQNLQASVKATHGYLTNHHAGAGVWLLALPHYHIAGIQVIMRSLHAGYTPMYLEKFSLPAFIQASHKLHTQYPHTARYTSLVPTQLIRLLDSPEGVEALKFYDGILIGGAATPTHIYEQCRKKNIAIIRTYGSSETSGGAVYEGKALPNVDIRIHPDSLSDPQAGRIILSGPMVASGYLNSSSSPSLENSFPEPHTFLTSDYGHYENSTLTVLGRIDSAINCGGLKLLPADIEKSILSVFPQSTPVVLGIPDPQWGEIPVAFFQRYSKDQDFTDNSEVTYRAEGSSPPFSFEELRSALTQQGVPSHLHPKEIRWVQRFPRTTLEKIDSRTLKTMPSLF